MSPILYLLIGVVLGGFIGWLLRGTKTTAPDSRIEDELRKQTDVLRANLERITAERLQAENARSAADASRDAIVQQRDSLTQQLSAMTVELRTLRDQFSVTNAALATTEANCIAATQRAAIQQRTHEEQYRVLSETHERSLSELRGTAGKSLLEQRQLQQNATTAAAKIQEKLEIEVREIRQRYSQASGELATVQAQLVAERKSLSDLRKEHEQAGVITAQLQERLHIIQRRNGELDAEVKFLNERLTAERQQIESMQDKLRKDFEAISNKLLVDSSSKFNQQSSESLEKLLSPLKENLNEFKTSLDTTRKEAATHSALLKDQVSRIGLEAANLAKALKGDAKVLGNWGENMLDQILEKSGLQHDIHYRRQSSMRDTDGDQRFLDVIVELPDRRNLVIDSKVSLRNYEESFNCADDAARLGLLDKHVEAVRKHFRDLGGRRYQDIHGINAPDFVLMYVPIEAAFFAAMAREPGLFAEALEYNVVLITNSTLLATLRTVAHVWRLADQQKHVLEIADRGGKMYDKFVGFIDDLKDLGNALKAGHAAWESASNKLHTGTGNLVRQAELMKTLGAKASKALPLQLIDKSTESDASHPALPPPL